MSTFVAASAASAELGFNAVPARGLQPGLAVAESWGESAWFSGVSNARYADAGSPRTEEENEPAPFPWRTSPPDSPDYKGAARDTAYFMVYQLAVIGLLYAAPESISEWTDEDKEDYNLEKWQQNVENPGRDTDDFVINYILHPYWGATYYIRGRERGFGRTQSFFFSAGLSLLFEYGWEAMFEEPSYQDMWATPVLGSLIGEIWFSPVRDRVKSKPGELTWQDKTVLFLTDPLGVVSAGTDRFLGIDSGISIRRIDTARALRVAGSNDGRKNLEPTLPAVPTEPAWGLQLRVTW